MFQQHPYDLFVWIKTGGGQVVNGRPVPETGDWQFVAKCRDEVNSDGQTVQVPDGNAFVYDSIIFLKKWVSALKRNERVKVVDGNGVIRLEKIIKNFNDGQLNCRVWV